MKDGHPKHIGRYKIKAALGKGAMGQVYKAFDPAMNRTVAIKTLLVETAEDGEELEHYKARFLREAQLGGRLHHPNILVVYDIGEHEGVPFIVMEYIDGQDLSGVIRGQDGLPKELFLEFMFALASGLDAAHEYGVVHRDIKPKNIMISNQGKVKILDFGIAKLIDRHKANQTEMTAMGAFIGTPKYASPEQVMGKKIDYRTDLFSLGAVAHELMTGAAPFAGSSISNVIYKIINGEANLLDPPEEWDADGERIRAAMVKMFSKEPKQRFSNGYDFVSELALALNLPLPARPNRSVSDSFGGTGSGDETTLLDGGEMETITRGSQEDTEMVSYQGENPLIRKGVRALVALAVLVSLVMIALEFQPKQQAPQQQARREEVISEPKPVELNLAKTDAPSEEAAPAESELAEEPQIKTAIVEDDPVQPEIKLPVEEKEEERPSTPPQRKEPDIEVVRDQKAKLEAVPQNAHGADLLPDNESEAQTTDKPENTQVQQEAESLVDTSLAENPIETVTAPVMFEPVKKKKPARPAFLDSLNHEVKERHVNSSDLKIQLKFPKDQLANLVGIDLVYQLEGGEEKDRTMAYKRGRFRAEIPKEDMGREAVALEYHFRVNMDGNRSYRVDNQGNPFATQLVVARRNLSGF